MSTAFKSWAKTHQRAAAELSKILDTRVKETETALRTAKDWDTARLLQGQVRALLDIAHTIQENTGDTRR